LETEVSERQIGGKTRHLLNTEIESTNRSNFTLDYKLPHCYIEATRYNILFFDSWELQYPNRGPKMGIFPTP